MTDDERLEHAFVQGAQWWEYNQTLGYTMWPSDRDRAYAQAKWLRERGDLGLSQDERLKKIAAERERADDDYLELFGGEPLPG